jgi:hypothetical protein
MLNDVNFFKIILNSVARTVICGGDKCKSATTIKSAHHFSPQSDTVRTLSQSLQVIMAESKERLIPAKSTACAARRLAPDHDVFFHDFGRRIEFHSQLPKLREEYLVLNDDEWQGLKIHLTKIVDGKVEIHMHLSICGQLALISPQKNKEAVYKHFDFMCTTLGLDY